MNTYRTSTELRYPNMIGETPVKYDYFSVPNSLSLPEDWDRMGMDQKYDFLNENGYWLAGYWDITAEQDKFIEDNDLAGTHDEVVVRFEEDVNV